MENEFYILDGVLYMQVTRETLDTQEQPAFKENGRSSEQRDKLRAALDQKVLFSC